MNQRAQDLQSGEPLQMRTRLGAAAPDALDLPDPEAPPDEPVQIHTAGHDVAARCNRGHPRAVESLGSK